MESFFSLFTVQAQCANFEYMLWFESLLFYGFEENSTLQKGDGDIGLLPAIVEKVILSKLSGSRHSMLREMSLACKPVENFSYYMHFSLLCVCGSVGRAGVGPTFQQSNNQVCELHSQTAKRLSHCAARGQPIHTGTPHPHHLFPQNTLAVRLPDIFRRTAVITLIPPLF